MPVFSPPVASHCLYQSNPVGLWPASKGAQPLHAPTGQEQLNWAASAETVLDAVLGDCWGLGLLASAHRTQMPLDWLQFSSVSILGFYQWGRQCPCTLCFQSFEKLFWPTIWQPGRIGMLVFIQLLSVKSNFSIYHQKHQKKVAKGITLLFYHLKGGNNFCLDRSKLNSLC